MSADDRLHVVIVGGGFGGVGCARELAKHDDVRVSLVDRNNYHQFQPLLYQVATSQLAPSDIAYSLRTLFKDDEDVDLVLGEVASIDPAGHAVTTTDGLRVAGDVLVLAAGSRPNFFRTAGAEEHAFPLYSLDDSVRLRSRILGVFEDADNDPSLVEQGALNFVIVGGGPTGVELAGALADLIQETMTREYHHLAVTAAQVHLVDLGTTLLAPFSDRAHAYVTKVLERKNVRLHLGVAVTEVGPGHVTLGDGTTIRTRCVVWGGGIMAPAVTADDALPHGRGGRIDVQPDLTVEGLPGVYAVGDVANIPGPDGNALPQLGSVALQSGAWAAHNIRAVARGDQAKPFHYHDKGIMAMIGRGAAIAEVGAHRHELHGVVAFSAWLGVHSALMLGVRNRIDAFVAWGWDNFSSTRGPQVLDRSDAARIDWGDDAEPQAGAPAS
jgi:NADH dehydrogenase